MVLAPIAGVFVDRWSRAYTMAVAVVARALLALPLLIVHSRADLPLILIVTLLINTASQFFMPAASAAVPSVVGSAKAGQANGLLQLINGGIAVIGPGGAALLFAHAGPHGTVVILGALYLLAAPLLAFVPAPRPAEGAGAGTSVLTEMADGLRYVRRSPLLMSLIGVAFVALLGVGALSVLDVVFVTRALHQRSEDVGLLLTSSGVGELIGGIVIAALSRWAARRYHLILGVAVVINGMAMVAYALAPTLLSAAAVLFVVGAWFPPIIVSFMTLTQLESEDAFMGRVMSLINTGMAVAMILSMTAGGVLTDLFGVRQVIGGGATVMIISGVLSLLVIRSTPAPRTVAAPTADAGAATAAAVGPVPVPVAEEAAS